MQANRIKTPRLTVHALQHGPEDGEVVLFVHGNASSSVFWEDVMQRMPAHYRCLAPDLRGYGDTEDLRIDATRGLADFVEDLQSLLRTLAIDRYHVVGHSLGGSVVFGLIAGESDRIHSVTLVNPGSPFGFGGTKGSAGEACWPDFAGSGGGIVNSVFTKYIRDKYRGSDDPLAAPRIVMNNFYWKPPFVPPQEEALLDSLLSEKIGDDRYPGDFVASGNYPFVAPGQWGPANALSPKYAGDSVARFLATPVKPPVLWVRGSHDQIVSDQSLFCFGTLGKMGLIPNYPGEAVYPPQPMVSQTRYVLEKYAANGGAYQEVIMEDTGHTPYIEQPEKFMDLLLAHLRM